MCLSACMYFCLCARGWVGGLEWVCWCRYVCAGGGGRCSRTNTYINTSTPTHPPTYTYMCFVCLVWGVRKRKRAYPCACVHVCTHVCACVPVCVSVCVSVRLHTFICCVPVGVGVSVSVCMCVGACRCGCTHLFVNVCWEIILQHVWTVVAYCINALTRCKMAAPIYNTCMHAFTHTHTHKHTHTHTQACARTHLP